MKIIHPSGEAYKLAPDTKLEMSRLNPFFNEYGEQSLPITLPPDEVNRRLTGYPDDISNHTKHIQRIDAVIQAGIFNVKARQAILSAKKKEGIKTTFYLNEGAFFEKFKDLQLSEIFKDKKVSFQSVENAISFVRSLMVTYDERFACFPVMLESDRPDVNKYLNRIEKKEKSDGYYSLYNEDVRSEIIGEKKVSIPAGYFISPFIRARHLLKEIFASVGYTLVDDSLLLNTEPFRSMVFLNNNIDTIVGNEILYSQIVPDCMASTILNIYRNKFCCEFIPNETNRTVSIVFFNDIISQKPVHDLTSITVSELDISYPKSFRQLKLSSKKADSQSAQDKYTGFEGLYEYKYPEETFDSLYDIMNKYPEAILNKIDGLIYRAGFRGNVMVFEFLGSLNCNYYAGGSLKTETKESPDVSIEMRATSASSTDPLYGFTWPFLLKSRALNSSIQFDDTSSDTSNTVEKTSDKTDVLNPMLCFVSHDPARKYDIGTIYNYDFRGERLWNYTLAYNGSDGLFEKFWRKYDTLLRNSLLEVSVDQILSETDKLALSSYRKVTIKNQEFIPNEIKYIPERSTTTTCSYFTTKLYNPLSEAMLEGNRIQSPPYYWTAEFSLSNTSKNFFVIKEQPAVIYYAPPTVSQFTTGGRYFSKTYQATLFSRSSGSGPLDPVDGTVTIWLEAKKY